MPQQAEAGTVLLLSFLALDKLQVPRQVHGIQYHQSKGDTPYHSPGPSTGSGCTVVFMLASMVVNTLLSLSAP